MNGMKLPDIDRRFVLLGAVAIPALYGCSNLFGPGAPPQLYVLRPSMPKADSAPTVTWQLSIGAPQAVSSLDTVRIALSQSPTTMDYFANAAWQDRAPTLIQGLMVEAFESTGKIVAVQRDASGIGANYLLQTELRDFEAQYAAPNTAPKIVVRMECRLLVVPEHRIVQTLSIMRDAQAERNDMDSIVTTFNRALSAGLEDLVGWTLKAPSIA